MKALKLTKLLTCAATAALSFSACGDDDGGQVDSTRFEVRVENVSPAFPILKSGDIAAPITPGTNFTTTFTAPPGARLSFAGMFVPSNDYFFSPNEEGIALWSGADRVTGDVTSQVMVWDAGTEVNQPLGMGADQVQNQGDTNTGAVDPDTNVRLAVDASIPDMAEVLLVELAAGATDTEFVLTISNVSSATFTLPDNTEMPIVVSPGTWVVHGGAGPLFSAGSPDRAEGLEAIAEDGSQATLVASAEAQQGINVPISPGVFAVHLSGVNPLFVDGDTDLGLGLEAIAEDGMPGTLATALGSNSAISDSGAFDTPVGATDPGGLGPGATPAAGYSFEINASPGDRLSFAAMFVASNDLVFAFGDDGIALFDGDTPVSGDVTSDVSIWDVGTEVNQEPGVGLDQVQRQAGANTGADEGGPVQNVADGFTYPSTSSVIRVTVTPL